VYGERCAKVCSNVMRCTVVGVFLEALCFSAVDVWSTCCYGIGH